MNPTATPAAFDGGASIPPRAGYPSARTLLQWCARLAGLQWAAGREGHSSTNRARRHSTDPASSADGRGLPTTCWPDWLRVARRPLAVDGIRCRCPPAKQRAPFVRGCVPEVSDPSHDMGRVRTLMQRTALTTACSAAAHRWFSSSAAEGPWVFGALVLPDPSIAQSGRLAVPFLPRRHDAALPSFRHALLTSSAPCPGSPGLQGCNAVPPCRPNQSASHRSRRRALLWR